MKYGVDNLLISSALENGGNCWHIAQICWELAINYWISTYAEFKSLDSDLDAYLAQEKGMFEKYYSSALNSLIRKQEKNSGYIYVLTNPSMQGLVKIGIAIKQTPEQRAKSLTSNTAVPLQFQLEYQRRVANVEDLETAIHIRLDEKRINKRREFFCITPMEAIAVIEQEIDDKFKRYGLPKITSGKTAPW